MDHKGRKLLLMASPIFLAVRKCMMRSVLPVNRFASARAVVLVIKAQGELGYEYSQGFFIKMGGQVAGFFP